MSCDNQPCPDCGGAVNTEHTAVEQLSDRNSDHKVTYIYCEFCDKGWETLWRLVGKDQWTEVFTNDWDVKTQPVELGKFMQRLKDNRAA